MLRALATIRARLTIAASLIVIVALGVGAYLLATTLRRSLADNIESAARIRVGDLAELARQGILPQTLTVHGDEETVVQVVDQGGRVVASAGDLPGKGPITQVRPVGLQPMSVGSIRTPDGDHLRVVAQSVTTADGPRTIYVGSSLDQVEETVQTLARMLWVGLPLLFALVAATTWYAVGRALRPVEVIRAEVADISGRDLDRRIAEPATDDEIGRLARTMNHTLDQLADAVRRQRRFVADASHELQSPVAASQTMLEVAIAHPESTEWPSLGSDLLDENQRLERLIRDLLFIARADAGAASPAAVPVDVDDVARAEVARLRPRSRLRFDVVGLQPVEVRADPDQLARALRNILENATRHAQGVVTVATRERDGWAEVVVADDGPGVPAADRERIFERFSRIDEARSRDDGGTGLGLPIAREIAVAHGGSLTLDEGEGGARFVMAIPPDGAKPGPHKR